MTQIIAANDTSKLNIASDCSCEVSIATNIRASNQEDKKSTKANDIGRQDRATTKSDRSFNIDISEADANAIFIKLKEQGILDPEDTLEQWLSEVSSQITDGANLTEHELLAGLVHFLQL